MEARNCRQYDEPEPDEDEDLLVDDVERQHADAVLDFDGAGRAVLVEGAFGYLGKYLGHRIASFLRVHL